MQEIKAMSQPAMHQEVIDDLDLLLGVLGALVPDLLARQPARVVDLWLRELPSRVERLRARRSGGLP